MFQFFKNIKKIKKSKNSNKENVPPEIKVKKDKSPTHKVDDKSSSTFTQVSNVNKEINLEEQVQNLSIELPKKFVNEPFIETYISSIKTSVSSMNTPKTCSPRNTKQRNFSNFTFETPSKPPIAPIKNQRSSRSDKKSTRTLQSLKSRASSAPGTESMDLIRDKDDPVYLSKFAGGYEPSPEKASRIEELDWLSNDYTSSLSLHRSQPRMGTLSCSTIRQRSQSVNANDKSKYQNFMFDKDQYDYVSRFKNERLQRVCKADQSQTYQKTKSKNIFPSHAKSENEVCDMKVKKLSEKLKKEIDEISKIENESSMAAELLPEIKYHQRELAQKNDIDPWKASRSRNANFEPNSRTRYICPINASPSRKCRSSRQSSSSNSPYLRRSILPSNATSTLYRNYNFTYSKSSLTESGSENVFHDDTETDNKIRDILKENQNFPNLVTSTAYFSRLKTTPYVVRQISGPRPGYGLSSSNKNAPKPKMQNYHISVYEFKKEVKDGANYLDTINAYKSHISTKVIPYNILKNNPGKHYPNFIDRENLEKYLSSKEFAQIFAMNQEQFYQLPLWRQRELKKNVYLF
ncbi:unnamed protein product [Brachionus calyciflorus]|uniref:HP domain-containing protein n=1 Tax=Brachionus calyciflorus TaxID=104777 RepID=A0A813M415_9BILA|nr:unnamed protein product [Brachionus calyciflorus]